MGSYCGTVTYLLKVGIFTSPNIWQQRNPHDNGPEELGGLDKNTIKAHFVRPKELLY